MTTSLQRQLAALAAPSSSLLVPERRRSSIIFTSQDAARYDKDTFYQIGLDGLNELISINPALFQPYENSMLFSQVAKKIERAVEDVEFNEKLDLVISDFLTSLYPYMMIKASLKCLEWLVYRFHIERFNVDAILQCVLPYYDTKTFVMVVQVLEVEKFQQNREWEWIVPCIQSGAPLRKAVLFDNCSSSFILWLFSNLEQILKIHKSHPENFRVYLGFMSSTIVGILNKLKSELSAHPHKIKNRKIIALNILNKIYDLLMNIRQNEEYSEIKNNEEIYSMTYVLMAMLSVCCREIPEMADITGMGLKKIFKIITTNRASSQLTETYLLINLMIEYLNRPWNFTSSNTFNKTLQDLAKVSEQWDLSTLATNMILHNIEIHGSPLKVMESVNSIQMSPDTRSDILRKVYIHYSGSKNKKLWAKFFLTNFERQYPIEYEIAIKNDPRFASDLTKFKTGKNFELLSQHPNAKLRAESVKKLIQKSLTKTVLNKNVVATQGKLKLVGKNKVVIKQKRIQPDNNRTAVALLPRFVDDDENVLLALLKPKLNSLLKIFTKQTLAKGLIAVMRKNVSFKSIKFATKKLCGVARILSDDDLELKNQIMTVILPLLFPLKPARLKLAKLILKTHFAREDEFLQQYDSVVDKENLSATEMSRKSYNLIKSMSENLRPKILMDIESATQCTLACLWLSPTQIIHKFLNSSSLKICSVSGLDYPIDEKSFGKCLKVAEKREYISLELVLTALAQSNMDDMDDIRTLIKFVWKSAEQVENRDVCMKFLSELLKVSFESKKDQFSFWVKTLSEICKQKSICSDSIKESDELTFFLARTIQFIDAFIQQYSIPDCTSNDSEENVSQEIHKSLTKRHGKEGSQSPSPKKVRGKKQQLNETNLNVNDSSSNAWPIIKILITQCLTDESRQIRTISFTCLLHLKSELNVKQDFGDLIQYIEQYQKEILTDHQQVPVVISRALENNGFETFKNLVYQSLNDETTEDFEKIKLLETIKYAGNKIFLELKPIVIKLLKSLPDSKVLEKILELLSGSLMDESIIQECLKHKELGKIVTKRIDRQTFEDYDVPVKKNILCLMIDQSLFCKVPEIKVAIQRCVRKWSLDCGLIAHELVKCIGMERKSVLGKTAKSNASSSENGGKDSTQKQQLEKDWLSRAEVVLEFVQGKRRLSEKTKLILPLFRLLKICMELEEQSPEYLKQLVLSSLTICCQVEDSADQVDPKDLVNFNVDAVISCLRLSNNPQTHHHGLILLNYAAKLFPEQVLHGIMSLFTFMGNHMIRQDDTYSTQLIQQTVFTIIPSLVSAGKGKLNEVSRLVVAAGIFRVFTSAIQDIPVHRRLPIFISLVETLQPEFSLWLFCIIVVDGALQRDRKKSNLNADLELAINLVWSFEPSSVVTSIESIYKFLISLPIYQKTISDEEFSGMKSRQNELDRSVLEFRGKESPRDVLIVIHYVLELVSQICSKFADLENSRLEYDKLLEKCLTFSRIVSGLNEEKLFRLIAHRNLEVIEKINTALEPSDFIEVVAVILVRDDVTVKRKVMEMLNQRLLQKIEWFGDLSDLLHLVPHLLKIVDSKPESDEEITVAQTAFLSLKLIARHLAIQHPDSFIPVFESAINQTHHKNKLLCASALLCIGELCCLKSLILPNLNSVTTAILKAVKVSGKLLLQGIDSMPPEEVAEVNVNEQGNVSIVVSESDHSAMVAHLLCTSAITCLNKMIEHLGSFVGVKFLKKGLVAVISITNQYGSGEKANHKKKIVAQKLSALLKTISTKIPLRNSLTSIQGAFTSLQKDPKGICILIRLLRDTLTSTTKADFGLIAQTLTESFLEDFLSYRFKIANVNIESNSSGDIEKVISPEDIDKIEDEIIDCLINGIVLKMSESHFRPFYHKMFDWAGNDISKLTTFYRLSATAAERLKSLFVTFAGYVIIKAVGCLQIDIILTKSIIKFLFHIFSNDREGFVTLDRFNAVVKPLVDLIESDYIIQGDLSIKDLNDTLIQLAVATNDLNRWQHLIELLSFRSNHASKIVRLNVLSTLEAAANELAKDFLTLLPPAVPFLAELMNDDDPDVENEAQKLILKLEDIVGEPLQPYFTS